jgi:hypothetical protein
MISAEELRKWCPSDAYLLYILNGEQPKRERLFCGAQWFLHSMLIAELQLKQREITTT